MSLNDLLKAKEEGRNLPWKNQTDNDFKEYYKKLYSGKSRWEVAKDDPAFYDALRERGIADDVLPEHRYAVKGDIEGFAREYANTITPVKELYAKYSIDENIYKKGHIDRYLKRAIKQKYITKSQYEKAVKRRQFLNLTGKYFSPEMKSKLFEIASKGYSYMKENQDSIIKEVVDDFTRHEKIGDKNQWLKTNQYFSCKYGKMTYSRPKRKNGDKICEKPISGEYITSILSKSQAARKIQDKRRRLISHLIWFFKIFTPGKHRYHSLK